MVGPDATVANNRATQYVTIPTLFEVATLPHHVVGNVTTVARCRPRHRCGFLGRGMFELPADIVRPPFARIRQQITLALYIHSCLPRMCSQVPGLCQTNPSSSASINPIGFA
jgi:hypothetical protein